MAVFCSFINTKRLQISLFLSIWSLILFRSCIIAIPCEFHGKIRLLLNNEHPSFYVELSPSLDRIDFRTSKNAIPFEVTLQFSEFPLLPSVIDDIKTHMAARCKSFMKSTNGWEIEHCVDDIMVQVTTSTRQACSYRANISNFPINNHISDVTVSNGNIARQQIVEFLRDQKSRFPDYTVIDVGGARVGSWSSEVIDALVDVDAENMPDDMLEVFNANINFESEWDPILEYVAKHGKFSFAICTHTIEDLALPQVTLNMLPRIAEEGFIAVPSKFREFAHVEGIGPASWLGYAHHRWICTFREGILKLYPKLSFLEQCTSLTGAVGREALDFTELSFFWKKSLPFSIVNSDFMGPSSAHVFDYFSELYWDDLNEITYPN